MKRGKMKKLWSCVPLLLLIILAITALFFNLHHYFSVDRLKEHHKSLEMFVHQRMLISVLIYSGLYVLTVSLSIPGATFMTLAGGFLFGQWIGTAAAVVSATLGGIIVFLSARLASRELLSQKAGRWIEKMKDGFQNNAFSYLITLRLIPLFPFVAINLAAAFFQLPLWTFFWGTFLGIIPGSFIYISLGVALREVIDKPNVSAALILEPKLLIALGGLGILSLAPIFYGWYSRKKLQK